MGLTSTSTIYSNEFPYETDWQDLKDMLEAYRDLKYWLDENYPTYKLCAEVKGVPSNPFELIKEILQQIGEQK